MAMQEPDKLKLRPEDEEYKNLLIQAFSILSKPNISTTNAVKQITALNISERTAWIVISDCQYVFGNVMEVNRLFLKTMRREALTKIIRKLEEMPKVDYKLVLEANKLLILLDDLPRALPQAESEEIQDMTIPIVEFTDNPAALIEDAQISEEEE